MKSQENKNCQVPPVAVIMGSKSDWKTMRVTCETLKEFGVRCQAKVVSAHRTPQEMYNFAQTASSRGYKIIVAGAGGAAHLPGMVASLTNLPVVGVPVKSRTLSGIDSLLSINQMPGGVPVATMAIGVAGARNAALFVVRTLALTNKQLGKKLQVFTEAQVQKVKSEEL